MMSRVSVLVMAVALARFDQVAPSQSAPPPTGAIAGQVIDAGSGTPVPNATVTLFPPAPAPGAQAGPVLPQRALSNGDGNFLFRSLAKGTFAISVSAPGYIGASYGQARPNGPSRQIEIEAGAVERVSVKIWKYATIAGTVVDDTGEPAAGVMVRVLQQQWSGGKRRWIPGSQTQTDDRGVYRITGLSPDNYLVATIFSVTNVPTTTVDTYHKAILENSGVDITPDFQMLGPPFTGGARIGDQFLQLTLNRGANAGMGTASGELLSYQTAFYPPAAGLSQATTIALASGEVRSSADMQLRLVHTVRVSGVARTPFGPAKFMNVKLVPADAADLASDSGLEIAATATNADGKFTFLAVPSGQYTLKMRDTPAVRDWDGTPMFPDPSFWASQPLAVGDRDVPDVAVTVRMGVGVSGRFAFETSGSPPPADRIVASSLALFPSDRGQPAVNVSPVNPDADGRFETPKYAPGRFTLLMTSPPGPNWHITSATSGGREVALDAIELGFEDLKDLVITFTDRNTEIAGTVRDGSGATADAQICALPFDVQGWIAAGMTARRSSIAVSSKTGAFTIRDLPPGDYVLVAIAAGAAINLQDPQLAAKLSAGGTRVTLASGDRKRQDLTVSAFR